MSLRAATAKDVPGMLALLRRHESLSLFPLARLASVGLGGEGPHAIEAWVAEERGGITGLVALSAAGMLMPQWPGAMFEQLLRPLSGRGITGAIGPSDQVRPMLAALGIETADARHDGDETGFVLELSDMVVPESDGRLVDPGPAERSLLVDWRANYLNEIFATPMPEAARQAPQDVDRWLSSGTHRLLEIEGQPVALTGFNARLPEVVQIGGVYVPPGLRGLGYARRVVAQHLAEARDQGVKRAALFAVSPPAIRAYRSIGFREYGHMALILFAAPQEVLA